MAKLRKAMKYNDLDTIRFVDVPRHVPTAADYRVQSKSPCGIAFRIVIRYPININLLLRC